MLARMVHNALAFLFNIAVTLVEKLGYWGVFFGMLIESACIPLPSEAIEGFAGYLASQGKMNLWIAGIVGALGNAAGSTIMYLMGKYGGKPLILKYGKYVLVGEEEFDKAEQWYGKYGDKAIFMAQLLPVIRTYISLPAGVLAKNYFRFIAFTFFGALVWCTALVYIGKVLGDHWEELSSYLKPVEYVVVGLVAVAAAWYIFHRVRKVKSKKVNKK